MALLDIRSNFYHSSIATALHNAVFGQHVTIYTLHRPTTSERQVGGTSPVFLDEALSKLKSVGFEFVSLEDIANAINKNISLPTKSVCFTVDDGYADQAEHLAPVFIKHNAKATFFLITDLLDRLDWPWDEKIRYIIQQTKVSGINPISAYALDQSLSLKNLSEKKIAARYLQNFGKTLPASEIANYILAISNACELPIGTSPPQECEPMSWDTARKLENDGILFGPHSANHYITSRLTTPEADYQFNHSWSRLCEELKAPVHVYCYPTGRAEDFNANSEQSLADKGYIAAVSMVSEPVRLKNGEAIQYKLPRISLPNSLDDVMRYASWFESARSMLP